MSSQEQPHRPQVEDPGEYNQRQRLEAIASARNEARQIRLTAEIGELNAEPETAFYTAVQNYAMELEWLIQRHGDDEYRTTKLGVITVPVPEELQDIRHGQISWKDGIVTKSGRILGDSHYRPKSQNVVGLVPTNQHTGIAYINLPPTWTETWTVNIDVRHEDSQKRTFEQTVGVPYNLSLSAFQLCNKFVNDMELDARIQKEIDRDPNPY